MKNRLWMAGLVLAGCGGAAETGDAQQSILAERILDGTEIFRTYDGNLDLSQVVIVPERGAEVDLESLIQPYRVGLNLGDEVVVISERLKGEVENGPCRWVPVFSTQQGIYVFVERCDDSTQNPHDWWRWHEKQTPDHDGRYPGRRFDLDFDPNDPDPGPGDDFLDGVVGQHTSGYPTQGGAPDDSGRGGSPDDARGSEGGSGGQGGSGSSGGGSSGSGSGSGSGGSSGSGSSGSGSSGGGGSGGGGRSSGGGYGGW